MSDSLTTKATKNVSSVCGAALISFGFSRRAPHLFRQSNDLFHCVHFQSSRWGSRDAGNFTINLVVTSASLYHHWTGRSLPTNPATALWPIQQRLGSVCPEGRDLWWDVSVETDVPALAAEISHRLQAHGLPFFDRFSSSSAILDIVQHGATLPGMTAPQMPLLRAMLLIDRDRRSEAAACITEALSQNRSDGFRTTILTIARRLKLPFDGSIGA